MTTHDRISDALLQAGVVDAAGLARAAEAQAKNPITLGRALADLGLATEAAVARTAAAALAVEYYEGELLVNAELAALLPADFCRKWSAFPLSLEGKRLRVAVTDPLNFQLLQNLEFRSGKKIAAVLVTQTWLEKALVPAPAPASSEPVTTSYDMLANVEPAGEVEAGDASSMSSTRRFWPRTRTCRRLSGWSI